MTEQGLNTLIDAYNTTRFDGLKLLVSKNKKDSELGKQMIKISNQLSALFPTQIQHDLH